jgi:hypothetical protein
MPQTNYIFDVWFLLPAAYQNAVNAKFLAYGLGANNFTAGLSASGSPPAQAYHAKILLRRRDLKRIVWFADNAPKAWIWIHVRRQYMQTGEAAALQRLVNSFDLAAYQDTAWQTRDKAYIKIGTGPINVSAALEWLSNNAQPSFSLQPITTE